jgi:hypothetical protein
MKSVTPSRQPLVLALGLALLFLPKVSSATTAYPPPINVRVTNIPQLNNEEQTAISPVDSNIIISVWRDFRLGYRQIGIGRSTDGGQTWTDSLIHPSMQYINIVNSFAFSPNTNWQSDPTLVVDRFGNFYISVLDFGNNAVNINDSSTISFYKSIDAGLSWTGPVPITSIFAPAFEDKQFITVDNSGGATDGNVYMSWTRFPNPDRIVFIRSTDGAASFEDTVVVGPIQMSTGCGGSQIDAGQFSIPIVGANGDVHVFWQGTRLDSSGFCSATLSVKHVVSSDGGLTFTSEDNIQQVSGYTTASGGINTYSQPVVDVDRTAGAFAGNMYLCFTNLGPEDGGRTDVDFMMSTDNALTWTSRVQLNDDANSGLNDSFHPWLFVNEEGVVIVIFYDNRFDPPIYNNFDLVATYSFDGGQTFTANHRITDVSSSPGSLFLGLANRQAPRFDYSGTFDPRDAPLLTPTSPQAGLIGEYIGLSANHDKIVATWTDSRDGNSEVYSSSWYIPLLEPKLISPDSGSLTLASPTFKWATSWKNGADRYRLQVATDPGFANPDLVATRTLDTTFNTLSFALPEGEYFWRVKTFNLSNSDSSEHSLVRSFQVDNTPPTTVTLLSPTDGEITLNPLPPFDWTDAFDGLSSVTYAIDISTDAGFPVGALTTTVTGLTVSNFFPTDSLTGDVPTFWRIRSSDFTGNESVSSTFSVTHNPSCCVISGDANHDGAFNIADVTFGIARIFSMGPAPVCQDEADANGDNSFNIADVTYGIARIFSMGPAPICGTTGD